MKVQPLLLTASAALLTACADSRTHVFQSKAAVPVLAESGSVYRGRPESFKPRVSVENAQLFDDAMFDGLRRDFLTPIEGSAYRYVIDSITFKADADRPGEWSLHVLLDTGIRVRIGDIVDRNDVGGTNFAQSYRRLIAALERVRASDDALDRYVHHWAG